MKARHLINGEKGETLAAEWLQSQGYSIIARNWKAGKYELDIIAMKGSWLVFVEVKTRANEAYGWPESSVTPAKINSLSIAATAYLEESGWDGEFRFDIIAVLRQEVMHFPDAFMPTAP